MDESRGQGMRLHVMDGKKWYLPCHSQALCCIETRGEVASHPWATGDGDKVWHTLESAILQTD